MIGNAETPFLVHGAATVPGAGAPVQYSVGLREGLASPTMHVLVPGFGGVKRLFRPLRHAMVVQEGLATLTYEPAREGGRVRDVLDAQRLHVDTISAVLEDLSSNEQLRDAPGGSELDLSSVVLDPQSMGGLAATERAKRYPSETKAVIYMGAIGFEEPVGAGLVGRLLLSASGDTAGKFANGKLVPGMSRLKTGLRVARYYLHNLPRTGGEIATCFQADVRRSAHLLGEIGVRTGVMFFGDDRIVPAHAELVEAVRHLVHICEVLDGLGHLAPQRQPEPVAAAVSDISARLERIETEDLELMAA